MSKFLHDKNNDNDDAKTKAKPWVFSENSQGKSDTNSRLLCFLAQGELL